jgi:hypothetical protein
MPFYFSLKSKRLFVKIVSISSSSSDVLLSNALDLETKQFCKNLSDSSNWVDKVASEWPAPIAHEYYRLREILAHEQQIISAIFYKDWNKWLKLNNCQNIGGGRWKICGNC